MINKKLFTEIKNDFLLYQKERGFINRISSDILSKSKKVIFLAHEGKIKEADQLLSEAKLQLKDLNKKYNKSNRLQFEGSYKAAAEEFLEAKFFVIVLKGKDVEISKDFKFNPEEYIGGLCDMTGELVRQCVLKANSVDIKVIENYREITNEIVGFLLGFYMTGKLRSKFDDVKRNLRRIETIIYEINLKK